MHVSVDNFMGSPRYDEIVDMLGSGGAAVVEEASDQAASDVLARESIVLNGTARTRDDAITEAGRLLVAAGAVDESYIDSMHERETSVSTMMGNGLAIPHGTNEAKGSIRRSAMSFVRYDDGIDWNGKPAEFVVGIAGAGDDHLGAAAQHRHGVRRRVAGGPAPCRHLGRRGARGPRRGECLTHPSIVRDERTLGSPDRVRSSRTTRGSGVSRPPSPRRVRR